jgi:hypothetical protein
MQFTSIKFWVLVKPKPKPLCNWAMKQAIPILLVLVIHYPANPFDKVCNWPVSGCTESSIHVTNADLEFFFGRWVTNWALTSKSWAGPRMISSESVPTNKPSEPKSISHTSRWHVCNSHISLWTHFGLRDRVWQNFFGGAMSCGSKLVSPLLLFYYLQIPSSWNICPVDPRQFSSSLFEIHKP